MRLLLVEDKDSFRRLLLRALEGTAWEVIEAADATRALEILETVPVDIMVTDLRLPGVSGLELLKRARRFNPSMRLILMSAFGEPKDIVEAMRYGADDFLPKPFDLEIFMDRLEKLKALHMAPPPDQREPWVVASKSMQVVENSLRAVADTTKPVLFTGQAGTGRSRAARRLHVLRHPVAPFHSGFARDILPDSLSETLLKDLNGGSLLIKDLEHLPPSSVSALYSCMERHSDLCWMGTCNDPHHLPEPLRSGMGVFCITLSPLAERRDDILPLFHLHLSEICKREGRILPMVDNKTEKELLGRDWSGNIAELVWVVSEAVRACSGGLLKEMPFGFESAARSILLPRPGMDKLGKMLQSITDSAERLFLEEALREANSDTNLAAESLGLTTRSYIHKLKDHGIEIGD